MNERWRFQKRNVVANDTKSATTCERATKRYIFKVRNHKRYICLLGSTSWDLLLCFYFYNYGIFCIKIII